MKKRIINLVILFLVFLSFWWFYFVNEKNYLKLKELKQNLINHPEFLPKKDIAKYSSFWFSNLKADIYWLEAIQYIGWNVIWGEYKKYLFVLLDLITELNPYFEKPYTIGQLLLPNYNERYENLSKEAQLKNIKQAEIIWLKWIRNFCDEKKINLIKEQNDLQKIWSDNKYKNPCKSANIAFWQAFLYYFYLHDTSKSAEFYKIASANEDSLSWAWIMAAIMSWKSWNREKSIMMFLTLANRETDDNCSMFSKELEKISYMVFRQWYKLNWKIIKNIEDLRKENFKFEENEEQKIISWDNCGNYINKAIRELNLAYIEEANKKYFEKTAKNASNAKELFDNWFLEFLPTDFQQYKDYGIIYVYNDETWNFDYKMWKY